MTSIKVKFRPSATPGREGRIYYRILHERTPRQLSTPYRILPDEWDDKRYRAIAAEGSPRQRLIQSVNDGIRSDLELISRICRNLGRRGLGFTADDVVDEFRLHREKSSLSRYMGRIIALQRQNGRTRTSEAYTSALNSFLKFIESPDPGDCSACDITLDRITPELMERYGAWLGSNGLIPNSIGFYTRILRAVYNRAVADGVIDDLRPFRKVYTGVDRTVKRALPLGVIRRMARLDLSSAPSLDYARDMFMMSFYLRGMSIVDMAFLKKTDLTDGRVAYRRRKTGQRLAIGWEPEMQMLLDKYPVNPTDYLLPIITRPQANPRNAYRNRAYAINRNLKRIAAILGVTVPLTLYVARHSWASAARSKGIPLSVISEGMGHDSEATTRIYLAGLDLSVVDKANSLILKSLKSPS